MHSPRLPLGPLLLALATPAAAQEPVQPNGDLERRLERLERRLGPELDGAPDVEGRPWYQNIGLSGYFAPAYLDSGGVGRQQDGSFILHEASVFLDADVWARTSLFLELRVRRFENVNDDIDIGELFVRYLHSTLDREGRELGVDVGRIDIPFGEEVRWEDATRNLLVTQSAGQPLGIDEGLVAFGAYRSLTWHAGLLNGNDGNSADDDNSKSVAARVAVAPSDVFRASASVLYTADARTSALRLGGNPLQPVGAGGALPSQAGFSGSEAVESILVQVDSTARTDGLLDVAVALGHGKVNDSDDAFDRRLTWFMVQPRLELREDVYVIARYSEIGTYDSDEGYLLGGGIVAGGTTLGFDSRRHQRLSVGAGWTPHPNAIVKLEVGKDRFELIGISPLKPENTERFFVACELVVSF